MNSVWYFVEDQTSRIECGVVYVFKIEECANKGMENGKLKLQKRKKYCRRALQSTGTGTGLTQDSRKRGGKRDSGWRAIEFCVGAGQRVEMTYA